MRIALLSQGVKLMADENFSTRRRDEKMPGSLSDSSKKKRGKVTCFSDRSASRLKEYLLRLVIPGGTRVVSWCLTLPCVDVKDWASIFKRFCDNMQYVGIGFIWRVELQKRKVPHLHCLAPLELLKTLEIRNQWYKSIGDTEYKGRPICSYDGFMSFGVSIQFVRDFRAFRYLCQHSSKHKTSQLGWKGRQWGIVGRKYLQFSNPKIGCLSKLGAENLESYLWKRYPFLVGRPIDSLVGYKFFDDDIPIYEIIGNLN